MENESSEIPGWLGDIPGWISVLGAAGVLLIGYFRRSRIMDWFKRATNAPPSFESQPSFTAVQKGTELRVFNHGPGEAFDVRCRILGSWGLQDISFIGQYNFDSIELDREVTLSFAVERSDPTGWATIEVSWILRHDPGSEPERDTKTFRLLGAPFRPDDEEEDFGGF